MVQPPSSHNRRYANTIGRTLGGVGRLLAPSRYYQATAQRETISTFVPSAPLYPCSALTMDSTFAADVSLSTDGKLVLFVISARNQSVQCSISREALEQHFWFPAAANDARTLQAFADSRQPRSPAA